MKPMNYFFSNWEKDKLKIDKQGITFIENVFLEKINFYNEKTKKYYLLKIISRSIFWSMHILTILSIILGFGITWKDQTGTETIFGIIMAVLQVLAWPSFFAGMHFKKSWKHNHTAFESLKLSYQKFTVGSNDSTKQFIVECEKIINLHNNWKNNK
ncbi:hypothetical protein [Spiroplasma endosymbiont of Amphibalanus improvisus]|uniref:hypothetical protein n=1 Tax=Spiroplasma endosymbiont of Amphibalanus improvisus TaxID=3066327 RepID=UPI00313E17B8